MQISQILQAAIQVLGWHSIRRDRASGIMAPGIPRKSVLLEMHWEEGQNKDQLMHMHKELALLQPI